MAQSASVAGLTRASVFCCRSVAAHLAACFEQRLYQRGQDIRRGRRIDEQRFRRPAHAGAAHLGVEHDAHRHVEIGVTVDVGVAEALEVREHRHARLLLHALDQALAATRHDDIDGAVEAAKHVADGGAVGCRHELDRRLGQAGALEAGDERRMDRQRRVEAFRSGAQDRRVAGLHRQRAGVGGHVGPAFVDDADDAERHAHALKAQAVRPRPFGQHRAHRIGQRGNLLDALGGRCDARLVEQQTIDERGRPSGGARGFHVLGIGGEDGRCRPTQRIGSRTQRLRLHSRRRQR